jgi:Zn-dependent peptidase ImmA (M78 family)/transcriptional regulator with XRE-family HTH domain
VLNPEIFKWARETAGLSVEDAASGLGIAHADKLLSIESGNEAPSRAVLLKMAKHYRRSLLTFYLSAPPQKGDRGEDFRTVVENRTIESDANLDALIRDLRARQSLVRSTLEDEESESLDFIGSTKLSQGVPATVRAIQNLLQLDVNEFRKQKRPEDAFSILRDRAEAGNIFVLLIGNLGSHHSAIPVEAFRGFAIADKIAPFVVINDQDSKTAWSFTLVHELAHLCLGTTGISAAPSEKAIEQFCNDVAGEFLLPEAELKLLVLPTPWQVDSSITAISKFAADRHLSRAMVAYKLYRAGKIPFVQWQKLDSRLKELSAKEKAQNKAKPKENESGPSYYVVRRHRLGKAILEFANRTLRSGALSPVKAAKVLGVKPRSVQPLLIDVARLSFGGQTGVNS